MKTSTIVKAAVSFAALSAVASPALAADVVQPVMDLTPIGKGLGAGLAAGLAVLGGAPGIGRIGGSAVEAIARQPEAAQQIGSNMILTAALVEGATLFAVVVGLLAIFLI